MAGRQLLVVGPTMMESPVTWRMITPAWSTGVPTMSNFGMLVPVTHPMTGPVSMEIWSNTVKITGKESRIQSYSYLYGFFCCWIPQNFFGSLQQIQGTVTNGLHRIVSLSSDAIILSTSWCITTYLLSSSRGNEILIFCINPVAPVPLDEVIKNRLNVVVEIANIYRLCFAKQRRFI